MDLFFNEDQIIRSDDISKLKEEIELIESYTSFGIDKMKYSEIENLKNALFNNGCNARAAYLLHLRTMEVFEFFDTPTLDNMFMSISSSPMKSFSHLSPLVSQMLSFVILSLHHDVKLFADLIQDYFQFDSSLSLIFAYSTFPSLFGYFTIEQYNELGSKLLIELINNHSSLTIVINSMISAFFFSNFRFNEDLWERFEQSVGITKDSTKAFKIFCNVLKKSIKFLTDQQVVIISLYSAINMNACIDVVMSDIFSRSCRLFSPRHEFFANYLESIATSKDEELFVDILAILTKGKRRCSRVPKLSSKIRTLPLIMSDRDICTLMELVKGSMQKFAITKVFFNEFANIFKNGYSPIYLEIPVNSTQTTCLKGENAPARYQRFYTQLLLEAKKKNVSLLKELSDSSLIKKFPLLSSNDFLQYSLNCYLKQRMDCYEMFLEVIDSKLNRKEVEEYGNSIIYIKNMILSRFAESHVKQMLAQNAKIDNFTKIMDVFAESKTDKRLLFDSLVAILNIIELKGNSKITMVVKKYQDYSNNLVQPAVLYWSKGNRKCANSIQRFLSRNCNTIESKKLGIHFTFLLKLMKVLNQIDKYINKNVKTETKNMLQFAFYKMNNIEEMVYLKLFVYENEIVRKRLDEKENRKIEMLFESYIIYLEYNQKLQNIYKTIK